MVRFPTGKRQEGGTHTGPALWPNQERGVPDAARGP